MDEPEDTVTGPHDDSPRPAPPTARRIGKYTIVGRIGAGGMGSVFEAEQDAPIRRKVALKLIRGELDSRRVVARFEVERQALAMMDHPHIAKVFDAGESEDGRPYFVMELVAGEPITEFCDRHGLSVRDRLDLFCSVCEAVQHAHHKGIVHRDIKPSNILVSLQDGHPAPKVIDFGIAKAIEPSRSADTMLTQIGEMVGTPAYMSPEQAAMAKDAVDTRTDVYGLGTLLYELLVGVPPIDLKTLGAAGFEDVRRLICEIDPERPSARIRLAGASAIQVAALRRTDPGALYRAVLGDLDWIVLRAIEKLPSRRYGSPYELAEDVRRHLRHEPVVAGPPSTAYVVGKFVRRHRLGVLASAAIVVGLSVGLVVATVGMVKARRAEEVARRSELSAREVADFLVGVFDVSDPSGNQGSTVTARELLDQAADSIEHRLAGDTLLRARLENTMGRVYHSLGLFDRSQELLQKALAERRTALGDAHPDVAESLRMLGILRQSTGAGAESIDLLQRSLAIDQSALGEDSPETAWSHYWLASSLFRFTDRLDESGEHLRAALRVFEKKFGPDSQPVAWCLNDLGTLVRTQGDEHEALDLWLKALAIKQKILRPNHPDLARAYENIGQSYSILGQYQEARTMFQRGLSIQETTLGPSHPDVGFAYTMLALVCARGGDTVAAHEADRRAMEILERTWGPDHPVLLYQHACLLAVLGQHDEAIEWVERALRRGVTPIQAQNDRDLDSLRGDPRFEAMVSSAASGGNGRPQL